MSGYTLGPWKAVRASHGPIDIFDAHGHDVVTVYGGRMGNATLIAAAPEMLEALRNLVEGFESYDNVDAYLGAARAAIAKATRGEEPPGPPVPPAIPPRVFG